MTASFPVSCLLTLLLLLLLHGSRAGSPCPNTRATYPCFCSSLQDGTTIVICPTVRNATHLELVTKQFKNQIVDRFILLNSFVGGEAAMLENEIVPLENVTSNRLPSKWLAEVRVRELEILGSNLHSCFLCNEAMEGQIDFLTGLTVKQSGLRGHLCSTCSNGDTSVSTRELRRTPKLRYVDFSYNDIEILDGMAFPAGLLELKKVVLSNNKISRINDGAFHNLVILAELDLSRNRLATVNRKMFKTHDRTLKTIDFSHNSIHVLPVNLFENLIGMREIKLSNNLLVTLPQHTFDKMPSNMEKIDVKGNFLVCNCTMAWIRTLSRTTKIAAHCVAPKEVEFQDLRSDLATIQNKCPN